MGCHRCSPPPPPPPPAAAPSPSPSNANIPGPEAATAASPVAAPASVVTAAVAPVAETLPASAAEVAEPVAPASAPPAALASAPLALTGAASLAVAVVAVVVACARTTGPSAKVLCASLTMLSEELASADVLSVCFLCVVCPAFLTIISFAAVWITSLNRRSVGLAVATTFTTLVTVLFWLFGIDFMADPFVYVDASIKLNCNNYGLFRGRKI